MWVVYFFRYLQKECEGELRVNSTISHVFLAVNLFTTVAPKNFWVWRKGCLFFFSFFGFPFGKEKCKISVKRNMQMRPVFTHFQQSCTTLVTVQRSSSSRIDKKRISALEALDRGAKQWLQKIGVFSDVHPDFQISGEAALDADRAQHQVRYMICSDLDLMVLNLLTQ